MNQRSRNYLITALASANLLAPTAFALDIDFKNGNWTHPSGPSVGWNSSQTTGVTALEDGTSATVTVSFAGAASPTPDNLKNIDASFYKGFAFQQWSAGAANATSLDNYMRMDFQFSSAVSLDNFLINDIDVFEVIQVEGWATSPGAPASGIAATYDMGDKLQSYSLGGLAGVTPKLAYPGNTTLDPESAVGVSFGSQVKAMSVYYSKQVSTASPYITAGIGGNLVVVHSSNPHLYYTYNLNNDSDEPVPVDFFDSLPGGLTWDTSYTPVMTGGLGLDVVYSNGDKDVAIAGLQMPPGNSALTLRTLETTLTGTIDNTAVITPAAETGLDPIMANASLNLAPSAPLAVPPFVEEFRNSGLGDFTWLILGDGASVFGSDYTLPGKVGVGPGATLEFASNPSSPAGPFPPGQLVTDPTATLIGGSAGATEDLSALKAQAFAINGEALAMAPTQTFGTISSSTVINGGAADGWNVIAIDNVLLQSSSDLLTIEGTADDYFIINIDQEIKFSSDATFILGANVEAAKVLINVRPGAPVKMSGQSLEIGATLLAPGSRVKIAGQAVLSGSMVTGGLQRVEQGIFVWGSILEGNASLFTVTTFGGSNPTIVLSEDFEGASPGIWSDGFWTYNSNSNFSNSAHGQVPGGGGKYAIPDPGPTRATVDLPGVLTASQLVAVAAGTGAWEFSAWLASWKNDNAVANVSVEWFDGAAGTGTSLGTAVLADGSAATNVVAVVKGTVLENDATNWNADNWSKYVTSGSVPAGAQSFVMTYTVNSGGDGYADNLSFEISE